MNRFRDTGMWRPLSSEQRDRAEQEYERLIRIEAGAIPGNLSERLSSFCRNNFQGWEERTSAIQFALAREVGQFYIVHNRLIDLKDSREVYLYHFLSRMRHRVKTNSGKVYRECIEYLDRFAPGWMRDQEEVDSMLLLESLLVDGHFQE